MSGSYLGAVLASEGEACEWPEMRSRPMVAVVGEMPQTASIAGIPVKRMLNRRYGFIDYRTMFPAFGGSAEPPRG